MLKPFYKYLANKIVSYFENDKPLFAGERFNYNMEESEQIEMLHKTLFLINDKRKTDLEIACPGNEIYKASAIRIDDVNLIIVTDNNATSHFITRLRNLVSNQEDQFKDTAILILTSNKLDSLSGGSASLEATGQPLHIPAVLNDLTDRVKNSDFTFAQKIILKESISIKQNEYQKDICSISDLTGIINIIENNIFRKEDYFAIGLFPDEELDSFSNEEQIKKRYEKNYEWFDDIQFLSHHGDLKNDLEGKLTQDGINKIIQSIENDDIPNIDYSSIISWNEKTDYSQIEFLNHWLSSEEICEEDIWIRQEGETRARKRKKSIIIFNKNAEENFTLNLVFDQRLIKSKAVLKQSNKQASISISGKELSLHINELDKNKTFVNLEYTDPNFNNNRFTFNVLIFNFEKNVLDNINDCFTINKKGLISIYSLNQVKFNKDAESVINHVLIPTSDKIFVEPDEMTIVRVKDVNEEKVPFVVSYKGVDVEMQITQDVIIPITISGWDVCQNKRVSKSSYGYTYEDEILKLTHKNQSYSVQKEYRRNILAEIEMISCFAYNWNEIQPDDKLLFNNDASLPDKLDQAYKAYFNYFKDRKLIPSLTYFDENLIVLAEDYVRTYLSELKSITEEQAIDVKLSDSLSHLGCVFVDQNRIKLSPFHPLNVAYQLKINAELGDEFLYDSILRKLKVGNLLPYFRSHSNTGAIFATKENDHSPEWNYYSNDISLKQFVSKHSIRNLVKQKILDFMEHFSFLFTYNSNVPIQVNAVNMGDCKEILQGLFDYYKHQLIKGNKDVNELRPIKVHVFGSESYVTKFEELAHFEDENEILEYFEINSKSNKYDNKDLIKAFREKVSYYISNNVSSEVYAHVTFFQFSGEQVNYNDVVMTNLPTGNSLGGLISDVPSFYDNTAYKTGYGTKYESDPCQMEELAKYQNALARVSGTSNPFISNTAICSTVHKDVKNELASYYKHSQWVTFIDPRFDLSFFKDDNDLIIIHYSDQFSNTSGYDAITVTQKSKQYQHILNEFLSEYDVSSEQIDQEIISLIDLFNAINGQWLLGLINTKNFNAKKEKLSLLSALKTFMAIHDHENITWIPISLEEILRISGGAGLSSKEGLFSNKNLGAKDKHCDDLLMIGLWEDGDELKLQFYPLEVKIGLNDSSVKSKANEQVNNTIKLFKEHLNNDSKPFISKLYRSLFAKLAIINAEKLKLYNIWNEKDWSIVIDKYRERLLNDNFSVSSDLSEYIGDGGTMYFTKDTTGTLSRTLKKQDDILSLIFFENDGYTLLLNSIPQIKHKFVNKETTLDHNKMLYKYNFNNPSKKEVIKEEKDPGIHVEKKIPVHINVSDENAKLKFEKITFEQKKDIYGKLLQKFAALKIEMEQIHIDEVLFIEGPAFYRMALYPSPSTTQSKIENSIKEINLVLGLSYEQSVRIFQDMGTVWLEVPKKKEQCIMVTTDHIWSQFKIDDNFRIPFGMNISGEVISVDFSSSNSPHLLMAGTTGSGKSVVLDTLIRSAAKFYSSKELNMFLIDPKGNELIDFEDLEHVPDANGESSEDAILLLERGVTEMQRRYKLFKEQKQTIGKAAKNLVDYNKNASYKLERWIIILDEYADLIEEDVENKKQIESLLKRLSQKARAAGIHVILATQKPLANIVSSSIKANLPGVLALKVKTAIDSRVVLDEGGAETLAGNGDSLFKNGTGKVVRVQCAIHLN